MMMPPISFIGNIGCGKSTWGKVLEQRGWIVYYEKLSEFSFLQEYWRNKANPFQTQIEFYSSWLHQYIQASKSENGLIDSSIISHHNIFTHKMLEEKLITQQEYNLCDKLYNNILEVTNCRYVYLYCNCEECLRRASVRARENELRNEQMIEYVQSRLQNIHDQCGQEMSVIDITNLSPKCDRDIDLFIRKIAGE
ncbi:MAG: deoxynucleoside kinase [Clostridia bacterium]|nr:deoxynucleoside kinase [Clostridia bacterium]